MIFPAELSVIDPTNVERYHSILTELKQIVLRSVGQCDPDDFNHERELLSSLRSLKKALSHCETMLAEVNSND